MIVVNSGQCFSMDLMSIVHAFGGSVPVSAEKGKRTCPVYDNGNKKNMQLVCTAGFFGEHQAFIGWQTRQGLG